MADNGNDNGNNNGNNDGNGNPTGDYKPNPYRRPSGIHQDKNGHPAHNSNGGTAWGWILLAILIVVFLGAAAWFFYTRWRAQRLGGPRPSLNPFSDRNRIGGGATRSGGLVGWAQEKFGALRRQRTAGGAYEGTTAGGTRRGRGMDPDEAWDTRVGNEADVYGGPPGYYEEQELGGLGRGGLHDGHNDSAYAGGGYGRPGYGPEGTLEDIDHHEDRGRRSELERRYDEETGGANPFGDHAEQSRMSLRGVSPRPAEDPSSPTSRRSMFKESI